MRERGIRTTVLYTSCDGIADNKPLMEDMRAILRLLQETCVAETVHWALIALSPLFLVLMEPVYNVIACLLYICPGNLPFIAIQRYNRPRLAAIYERQLRWQREEAH